MCIVHLVRHSLRYVNWKPHKDVSADLKRVYCAAPINEAEQTLEAFTEKLNGEHPTISRS
ncbi:hypothetical protein GCM10011352_04610 [Marinobacterium zhoushanense]|uniref:Mutator family transposase n=1 Tax=Marinobacterium zhoushanense TaxID=1679163 RepID=A0ABQ1K2A7_9GAMM|nr:hypothetical protein GCM10011352_04610 [Marinobacterium zhoushanense]